MGEKGIESKRGGYGREALPSNTGLVGRSPVQISIEQRPGAEPLGVSLQMLLPKSTSTWPPFGLASKLWVAN